MIKLSSTKIKTFLLVLSLIGGGLLVVNKTSAQLPEFSQTHYFYTANQYCTILKNSYPDQPGMAASNCKLVQTNWGLTGDGFCQSPIMACIDSDATWGQGDPYQNVCPSHFEWYIGQPTIAQKSGLNCNAEILAWSGWEKKGDSAYCNDLGVCDQVPCGEWYYLNPDPLGNRILSPGNLCFTDRTNLLPAEPSNI